MSFLENVLEKPCYGFTRGGKLYKPSISEIFREFLFRINIFNDLKHWLSTFQWTAAFLFFIPLYIFLTQYFSWPLMVIGFIYSMVIMGSHGTTWLHRYSTHRAYKFSHPFWRFICRNLVIKVVPEESYVVSHHVHHKLVEQPGDPYNALCGFLYCFLADVIHQPISKSLTEKEYEKTLQLMNHTGVKMNTYAQYQKWGSVCHPFYTFVHFALNWVFWFATFFLIGGMPLATAIFGWAAVWAIGIRTFNYDGHGRGKDLRRKGIDFNWDDISINRAWPGIVAGEWHNNHHLYPRGARSGFLPSQIDFPWYFIWAWHKLGFISSYQDPKADFYKRFYNSTLKGNNSTNLKEQTAS